MTMARKDSRAAHQLRLCKASAVAVAALIATACDRDADHPAMRAAFNTQDIPYRAAIAMREPGQVTNVDQGQPPAIAVGRANRPARKALVPLIAPIAASPHIPLALPPRTAEKLLEPRLATLAVAPIGAVESSRPLTLAAPVDSAPSATRRHPDESAPSAFVEIEVATPRPFSARETRALAPSSGALAAAALSPSAPSNSPAYVSQISDNVRAAYITQVDVSGSDQRLAVRSGGRVLGAVQFQVNDGMVSVNIGQVLDLFEGRIDSARFAELRESQAALEFVSLDQLRSAGVPLDYNAAYDELTLDSNRG